MTSPSIHGLCPALNDGIVVYYINVAYIGDSFAENKTVARKI